MKADDLKVLGFVDAGVCALDARLKSGVRFTVTQHRDQRVIYAFAVDGEVKYVGVCDSTQTCLGDRMQRYQGIMGAGTNERITGHLREALSQSSAARILVWQPGQDVRIGDLRVDLVKGLENPLIALARPEWNIHG